MLFIVCESEEPRHLGILVGKHPSCGLAVVPDFHTLHWIGGEEPVLHRVVKQGPHRRELAVFDALRRTTGCYEGIFPGDDVRARDSAGIVMTEVLLNLANIRTPGRNGA